MQIENDGKPLRQTSICYTKFCFAGCEYRDIGFLLDSSGSIGENPDVFDTYELMRRFVRRIIGRIDIGPTRNLVGLVQFSSTVETVFTFNTYRNDSRAAIYQAIHDMALLNENTNTALGLRSSLLLLLTKAAFNR